MSLPAVSGGRPPSAAPAVKWFGAVAAGVALETTFAFGRGFWLGAGLITATVWGMAHRGGWRFATSLLLIVWGAVAGWLTNHHHMEQAAWLAAFPPGPGVWEARVVSVPLGDSEKPEWVVRPIDRPAGNRGPLVIVRPSEFVTEAYTDDRMGGVARALRNTNIGDLISIEGSFVEPNPAGNPGEFDFRAYQLRQGIVGTVFAQHVHHLGDKRSLGWLERQRVYVQEALHWLRAYVRNRILEHTSERAGPLLLAMLTGDRSAMDPDVENAFRRTGLSHLMAVSGLHVGLVAGLALAAIRWVGWQGWRRFIFVASLIVFYVAFTGGKPSALRAGMMAIAGLAALSLGRRTSSLQFWALAGAGLLLYQPHLLQDIGFQLSFAASGVIILWVGAARTLTIPSGWWARFLLSVRVNIAAQIGTLPLLAYHFNEISLAGWGVNFIVIPLAAPVVYGGVIGVLLAVIPWPVGGWILQGTSWFLGLILYWIEVIGHFSWAMVEVPSPNGLFMGASALIVVGLAWCQAFWEQRLRIAGKWLIFVAISMLLVVGATPLVALWEQRVEIVFLDVGQGDAILIRTPRGRTVLVDGGGSPRNPENPNDFFDVGLRRIMPYLRYRGIRHLDALVNTHPHEDHLQGLVAILRNRRVSYVIDAGDVEDTPTYREYTALITELPVDYRVVTKHDVIQLEPAIYLEVLHPSDDDTELRGLNNRSLILRLVTPHGAVLLTGDLERAGQQELLWGGEKQDLTARVIKVPHHGSERDLERRFIDAVGPVLAVVQVGRNSFGHPSSAVIRAYEERGAQVLRTDQHGAITVRLTKRGLYVNTFR